MANTTPCVPPSESNLPQLVADTPPKPHFAAKENYRTRDLSLGRQAVLEGLRKYLRVPYATLIHSIFGDFASANTSSIRQKLVDEGVLNAASDTTASQWAGFTVTPAQSNVSENLTFEPLVHLISSVFNQVSDCQLFVAANPSMTPVSECRDTSHPDVYIIDRRPAAKEERDIIPNRIHWFDIAVTFEFKKGNDRNLKKDNEEKIIWSLHHIMREDPLRRFALGITIEDSDMRLWYHSRAFLAVSEPINFLTNIDEVISLFYLIGTMSAVQLGWDPTVKRIYEENKIQYVFKVNDETFTTTRPLATFGADVMVGRGTRVYEAQDAKGNIVAIKDSWRDEDRDPEGAILEKIMEDIQKNLGEEDAAKAMKHFVAIRVYGDVVISGKTDKTITLRLEEGDITRLQWTTTGGEPILSERRHLPSTGHIPDSKCRLSMEDPARPADFKIPCKIHGRTVFKDVGDPLMGVTCLSDNVTCLSGAQQALYYLHKAGWVHRDFSAANVLWIKGNDRPEYIGKLSDFEYAKRVDSTVSHDVRTGTMQSMAIEVDQQAYLFSPKNAEQSSLSPSNEPPFRMNFLHDLESLWWTAVWILMYHTDKDSPTRDLVGQSKAFHTAFTYSLGRATRQSFFMVPRIHQSIFRNLSGTYSGACSDILELGFKLQSFYERAEASYPIIKLDKDLQEDAHKKVSDALSGVVKKLEGSDIHLIPLYKFMRKKRDLSDSHTQQATKMARRE